MDKKDRINAAFNYLKENGIIHTQRDLAQAIGATAPNVSRMLKGDPKVLTDNICVRIQKAFGMISANWLMHEEGEMVIVDNDNDQQFDAPDYDSMVNSIIAGRDAHIKTLEDEIQKLEKSHQRELEAKDETIHSLRQQVKDLRFYLSTYRSKEALDDYPFPKGAADDNQLQSNLSTD